MNPVAIPTTPPRPPQPAATFDWQELRDGAREVFLTLTATIALGLGWVALEVGWAQIAQGDRDGAAALATGYASASPTAR